jgi:hypothetical protein
MNDGFRPRGMPMTEPIDITGRWSGYYCQHGREHPISAIFAQVDAHVQGKMTDSVTSVDKSIFEYAFDAGLPPGADEQIYVQLRKEHPGALRSPIQANWRLPEFSTLEGEITGRQVRFVKRYIGESFAGWRIGEKLVGETVTDRADEYAGMIEADGNSIEGHWSAPSKAKKQMPAVGGRFQLHRIDE